MKKLFICILCNLFLCITAHAQIKTFAELYALRDLPFGKFCELMKKANFVQDKDAETFPKLKSHYFFTPDKKNTDAVSYAKVKDHGVYINYTTSRIGMIKNVKENLLKEGYTLLADDGDNQVYTKGKLFFVVTYREFTKVIGYQMGQDFLSMARFENAE